MPRAAATQRVPGTAASAADASAARAAHRLLRAIPRRRTAPPARPPAAPQPVAGDGRYRACQAQGAQRNAAPPCHLRTAADWPALAAHLQRVRRCSPACNQRPSERRPGHCRCLRVRGWCARVGASASGPSGHLPGQTGAVASSLPIRTIVTAASTSHLTAGRQRAVAAAAGREAPPATACWPCGDYTSGHAALQPRPSAGAGSGTYTSHGVPRCRVWGLATSPREAETAIVPRMCSEAGAVCPQLVVNDIMSSADRFQEQALAQGCLCRCDGEQCLGQRAPA